MISEQAAIAWLCFMRWQHEHEHTLGMPADVFANLVERGWIRSYPEDWEGSRPTEPTPEGHAITDIHGPDYGLETLETA